MDKIIGAIIEKLTGVIERLPVESRVAAINKAKAALSAISPFASEPVDHVVWVSSDMVEANSYNPNTVAPPEMKLLEQSIRQDGYTQPIVVWHREDGKYEVVDGFHRNRVGKECEEIRDRVHGYLPVTVINQHRAEKNDRMVSTIRHNRARGKHSVDSMSDIVVELRRRNWTDEKISRDLGMEVDEILRLCQISGLTEMFKDAGFSKSWDIDTTVNQTMGSLLDEAEEALMSEGMEDEAAVD